MEQTQTKRIVLGITGGIAAYKAAELARLLVKRGFEVRAAMTPAATQFVTPLTLQALTGHPVLLDQWLDEQGMAHIQGSRDADAIVIAPATADFMAKLAHGLADDLLSTLCLARDCPLWLAPAMNQQMWAHPATQRNVRQLEADGAVLFGPASGNLACGEQGMGRMLEAEALCAAIANQFEPHTPLLRGRHVLITAGPTYEPIDAVRGITNRSSGKMGYALAHAAQEMGANVILVSGPVSLETPEGVKRIAVETAAEMLAAVDRHVRDCDLFIAVAAVADYRVAAASEHKIKKSEEALALQLVPNPDILAHVAALPNPPYCVGFAAESRNMPEYAEQKRRAKNIPLLIGNLAQTAIGSDDNEVTLFDDRGAHPLPRADKITLARQLITEIAYRYTGEPR